MIRIIQILNNYKKIVHLNKFMTLKLPNYKQIKTKHQKIYNYKIKIILVKEKLINNLILIRMKNHLKI